MTRSLIQGIEVTRDGDRLIVRNTWGRATLSVHLHLAFGFAFCGGFGLMVGFVRDDFPESIVQRAIRIGAPTCGIPLAILSLAALLHRTLRHRRPYILDRQADRLMDGSTVVGVLSEIRHVRVEEWGSDPTEYTLSCLLTNGRKLTTLGSRIDEFRRREDAERLASEVADFLGVSVVAGDAGKT